MARLSAVARLSLGVLISGRGSNLQALIDACARPSFPAQMALVISSRPGAPGLNRAARAGIPSQVIDNRAYPDRAGFEHALDAALRDAGVGLVCLAGFVRLLTPAFCAAWRDRLINVHPSLLPAFKGLGAQAQALAAGVRVAGCTVHYVRAEADAGPILLQAAAPVLPDDDEAALSARILALEHRLYPEAVRLIAEGRARIVGERCVVDGLPPPLGLAPG